MDALIAQLPEAGSHWSTDQRRKWLAAATSILDLVYPSAPEKVAVIKGDVPLTQSQTAVLDFIASKSSDGQFLEISMQQLAMGCGVPLGSLGSIVPALIDRGLIESKPGDEPRSPKKYRVVSQSDDATPKV